MTDQELLELAAKAAGVDGEWLEDEFWLRGERTSDNDRTWNPLLRDGEALRLAVKLRLCLFLEIPRIGIGPMIDGPEIYLEDGDDEMAATRRAIVQAAADIGRKISAP